MSDAIPTELLDRRYRLQVLLGRGGMGAVYRALDTRLDRPVAIKMLRDVDGADEERFDAEVRLLARFAHPNLVRVLDAGEFESRPFLVMELIEGVTLAQRLGSGNMASEEVAKIGAGIAAALAYVHEAGIVHRDVKPANILLDQGGDAHLADFGIARLVDTTGMTATGLTLGTPAYLAPEQIQGSEIGPSADIYALGLVLFECLTGHRAFEGTASEITAARLGRDPEIPSGLDPMWQRLLRSMTIRNSSDRATASNIATTLSHRTRAGDLFPTVPMETKQSDETIAFVAGSGHGDTERAAPTETAVDRTRVAQPTADAASLPAHRVFAKKSLALGIALGAVALAFGLIYGGVFSSSPSANRSSNSGLSTSTSSTTSSTTTSTSTTTTVPLETVASTANNLASNLQAGVTSGNVARPAAQQLDNQLQPLLSPPPGAQPQQQIQQFDVLVQSYDQDVAKGMITGTSTITALTTSIDGLATALGTTLPTTTIVTVPTAPGPGGKGNGHGHGHGHD